MLIVQFLLRVFSFSILQDSTNCERAVVIQNGDRCDVVSNTALEKAVTGNTRTDLGPVPNWTLDEYCRECAGVMTPDVLTPWRLAAGVLLFTIEVASTMIPH